MKYILKDKTPLPCPDEDLWLAWHRSQNIFLASYNTDNHLIRMTFMGKPVIYPGTNIKNFFKVSVLKKTVVLQSTFHERYEEAENKYNEMIFHYLRTFH